MAEMYCRICGDESATYRPRSLQALCDACAADTPRKVGRAAFDRAYWGAERPPEGIAREFYSDYLASSCTLAQYIQQTTEGGGAC